MQAAGSNCACAGAPGPLVREPPALSAQTPCEDAAASLGRGWTGPGRLPAACSALVCPPD